jgi:hypothetical protein
MPEFEEKSSLSAIADETSVEAPDGVEDECESVAGDAAVSNEERSRYALKRGRMPASAAQKKVNQKIVRIDEVCQDAIGTRKGRPSVVQKSTTVVEKSTTAVAEKNTNGGRRSCEEAACQCGKRVEKSAKHEDTQECVTHKCACGPVCKFIKKFLRFFGLCKGSKCERQQPRAYHHRSRPQRKSGARDGNRQAN